MSFANRLNELRRRKGESLHELAEAIGVSKTHIWELEKGTAKNPSINLLKDLANHFKVSVATLVGEDLSASGTDEDLVRMFRQANESDLDETEKMFLDDALQNLLKMKKARQGGD